MAAMTMQDLDNAYREAFVDAWANQKGAEPHEAAVLSIFLLGVTAAEACAYNPELMDADITELIRTQTPTESAAGL